MGTQNYIELIDINKTYDDGFVAVNDINLKINKGEFVTFLGPSGCGKTTILKMIAGFEMPTSGKIMVGNKDIKDLSINQRPTATVFQDYALFPNMTVYENITYGLKVMRKPMKDIPPSVKKAALKVYADAVKKAHGKIKQIEKQKLSIAKEIAKVEKDYEKKPEIYAIKSMRYSQYMTKIMQLSVQMKKRYGETANFHYTFKNKLITFVNNLQKIFGIQKPIKYDLSKMNEYEIMIYDLRKWYLFKQQFDIKLDKLNYRYNDLDFWISYWENFPMQEKEWYEKRNVTRVLSKEDVAKRANEVIKLVGLEGKEKKYPEELSGGMQQRVALSRAIVVEPEILLLDEPLSALDAKVRAQMQAELKRLHKELGLTFILVTHDQGEALSLSNKVVVMSKGKIEQIDTPKAIYDNPANEWVARFIGRANIFDGIYTDEQKISVNNVLIEFKPTGKIFKIGQKIKVMIRPEDFKIVPIDTGFLNAKVIEATYKGMMWELKCHWSNSEIIVETVETVKIGTVVGLKWDTKNVHIMKEKGVSI